MCESGSDYSQVSNTELKCDLAQLAQNLYNIDLQIQNLRSQGNQQGQIATLEAAKVQIQKEVVEKEITLELKDTQKRAARRVRRGQQ